MIHLNELEKELIMVPLPQKTESYSPVPHSDFIRTIQQKLSDDGYRITNKRYWTNGSMSQVVGRYSVDYQDNDMELAIGFKNSYDKSISAGVAIGQGQIIVCKNGMVKGEFAMKRKHTGTAREELTEFVNKSMEQSTDRFKSLCAIRDRLKEKVLHQSVINELIGKMFIEEEILRSEQLNIVKRELLAKEPTFDYGVDRDCAWNIYSVCSYAVDHKTTPGLYVNQHGKLLGLFENLIEKEESLEENSVYLLNA